MTDKNTLNVERRSSHCQFAFEKDKKLILCVPPEGESMVVLSTPSLFYWYSWAIAHTEIGMEFFFDAIKIAGWSNGEPILKISNGYSLCFHNNSLIQVYGIIITELPDGNPYSFTTTSAKKIEGGSPFSLLRYSVFLSHSSADKKIVRYFDEKLHPHFDTWIDEKFINYGDLIYDGLNDGLSKSEVVVFFLSRKSIGSDWVKKEVGYALSEGKFILPIRLEDCDVPPLLKGLKYLDYFSDKTGAIKSAIKAISIGMKGKAE